jgi:hypothetical protein
MSWYDLFQIIFISSLEAFSNFSSIDSDLNLAWTLSGFCKDVSFFYLRFAALEDVRRNK